MFNPNGYDIKGVKYLPTRDGVAFTGTLYKDGKRTGSVENGGTGGPNCAHFDTRAYETAFRAWVATLGTHTYPARNGRPELTVPFDEETAIECLLQIDDARREARAFDRRAQKAIVYREAGDGPDQYRSVKFASTLTPTRALAAYRASAPWWSRVTEVWHIGEGWKPERPTPQD